MDETQDQRRQWILDEAPPAQDVLMEFPVFRIQKWVSSFSSFFGNLPIITYVYISSRLEGNLR